MSVFRKSYTWRRRRNCPCGSRVPGGRRARSTRPDWSTTSTMWWAYVRGSDASSGATELERSGESWDHWSHARLEPWAETEGWPGGGGTAVKSKQCPSPTGEKPGVRGRPPGEPWGGVVGRATSRGRAGESSTRRPSSSLGAGADLLGSFTGPSR